LRPYSKLETLDIGPAKGVESLSLDSCHSLKRLTLAVMPRLTETSGRHFPHTVTYLDIRGSHSISPRILASFTALREVRIGTASKLRSADFPQCRPSIICSPI
jgi:hypothetical protein